MIRRIREAARTARDVVVMLWYVVGAFVDEPLCAYCEVAESDCICKGGPRT